jgi:hypothetical protein
MSTEAVQMSDYNSEIFKVLEILLQHITSKRMLRYLTVLWSVSLRSSDQTINLYFLTHKYVYSVT